jgi:malonyl-CoA/methylmalonyl-CoA synthetase
MILYTSGTTSKPKGVVHTHGSITSQILSLVEGWGWRPEDRILLVLPLHHIHGIVNVLLCALWAGATCDISQRFNADDMWDRFIDGDLTLFMAVPTIYVRLIAAWDAAKPDQKARMAQACTKMRLTVSGSAALPVSVFEKWKEISGHTMLERYGMTEIGMALSNPLHGERRPGYVGLPLPGVRTRLVDDSGGPITQEGQPGEIQVKSPNVFQEYWGKPEATALAFSDGWFATGDIAVVEHGYYRILGRNSVDIIKTGGYKVSALEIEEVLRTHPRITECAVVGAPDPEWGERVCAAVILEAGQSIALDDLRDWAKERLASYKVPTRILCLDDLPRNAMGKVTKPNVKELFT